MLSSITNALSNAIEAAFAPETSLYQDFQYHWQAIMNYYSEYADESVHIDSTNIPSHLKEMLSILVSEANAIEDLNAGPCMEFFLRQKILETLATLGTGDTPMGMKSNCLWFFTMIFARVNQPLMALPSVFNPTINLIKVCGKVQASPTEMEEINFLSIICQKLSHETHLVKFFMVDEDFENKIKEQKLQMEFHATADVLHQRQMDKKKEQMAELTSQSSNSQIISNTSTSGTSSAVQSNLKSDKEEEDENGQENNKIDLPENESDEDQPNEELEKINRNVSKDSDKEGQEAPDEPEILKDKLNADKLHSTSTSKYRSASGNTANFTDSSSSRLESSRNTSKDRDSPVGNDNNSVITDSSRSTDLSKDSDVGSKLSSKAADNNNNGSISQSHSPLSRSRQVSGSSIVQPSDQLSQISSANSKISKITNSSSSKNSVSNSTNSNSNPSSSINSNSNKSSKLSSAIISDTRKLKILSRSSSEPISAAMEVSSFHSRFNNSNNSNYSSNASTNPSLLTTSENCSDTDDENTNFSDEDNNFGNFIILKISLFGHNRKELENASRQLKVYMQTYQEKRPSFDLAESLINLLRSPDARISIKAMDCLLRLVSLPEKNCANMLLKNTRIREFFGMKLVHEIMSLPGPQCHPRVAAISPDEIHMTDAYPYAQAIDPVLENMEWFPGKKELRQFLTTWSFINRLIIESYHYFAVPMARYIRRKVLQPILKQILTKSVEEEAIVSFSSLLIKLLDTTESWALRHQLMMFILGRHESTFNHEIHKKDLFDRSILRKKPGFLNAADLKNTRKKILAVSSKNIFEIFLARCNHPNDDLAIVNLKIFEACLKSPEQIFMDQMILKFVDSRQYLEDKSFIPKFNIQEAVNAYRTMLPHNLRTSDYNDRATESYIHDYYSELQDILRVCQRLRWPKVLVVRNRPGRTLSLDDLEAEDSSRPSSRVSSRITNSSRVSSEISHITSSGRSSNSFSSSHYRKTRRKSGYSENPYDSDDENKLNSNASYDYEPFEEGPFLKMLFDKLEAFCTQSYAINLEVTNLIAKLMILPHPAITEFFLNPEIYNKNKSCRLKEDVRTPYSILNKIVIKLIARTVKIPDIQRLLRRRKKRMENPDLPRWHDVPLDEETENLLSSIILLEEFCKELAAITVVKFEMAEKTLKQQQHRMALQNPQNQNFKKGRTANLGNSSSGGVVISSLGQGNLGFGGGNILVSANDAKAGISDL